MPTTPTVTSIDSKRQHNRVSFKEVLDEIMHRNRMNQRELAAKSGVSQPQISRIERGVRSLTADTAAKIAKTLGGNPEDWLRVYELIEGGESLQIEQYLTMLGYQTEPTSSGIGVLVRQLQRADILSLFQRENIDDVPENDDDLCEISDFRSDMVHATSYDLTAGHVADDKDADGNWVPVPTDEDIVIAPRQARIVGAHEHVKLPVWLEAELCPPSNLALTHLQVSHGPVINPGWDGVILVSVFNPTDQNIVIKLGTPFMTMRFWATEQ